MTDELNIESVKGPAEMTLGMTATVIYPADLRERMTTAIKADPIAEISQALRNASGPEPEAWEENICWDTMALAVLDLFSPRILALEQQLAEARAAERERCAKVVEKWPHSFDFDLSSSERDAATRIAAAIRALRDPGE